MSTCDMFHGQNKECMSCEIGTNIENGDNSLKNIEKNIIDVNDAFSMENEVELMSD